MSLQAHRWSGRGDGSPSRLFPSPRTLQSADARPDLILQSVKNPQTKSGVLEITVLSPNFNFLPALDCVKQYNPDSCTNLDSKSMLFTTRVHWTRLFESVSPLIIIFLQIHHDFWGGKYLTMHHQPFT